MINSTYELAVHLAGTTTPRRLKRVISQSGGLVHKSYGSACKSATLISLDEAVEWVNVSQITKKSLKRVRHDH